MEKISLPDKYDVKKVDTNKSDIIIEPCYPGYGSTLGNALRRVLLSSLPGAAVTAIKIKGIDHEFSNIEGVKEDVVELILNIKKIRFKLHENEEAKATLKVKGEAKVTSKDIKSTSDVDIVDQNQEIATLTSKNAELEIEFFLKKGRGYVPVESIEKKKFQLGTIAVDAIFTPVKMVNYRVENVRVGQMTNYDKLILTVETDGSLEPEEAVKYASEILVDHFSKIKDPAIKLKETADEEIIKEKKVEKKEKETLEEKPKKKRGRPKKDS
ncbi:MAG: DNA-directed RNA polymerase subunit alpha [bacterium]|nr:DNA-directed RNA polymerase subunit alpha [bacterium]